MRCVLMFLLVVLVTFVVLVTWACLIASAKNQERGDLVGLYRSSERHS